MGRRPFRIARWHARLLDYNYTIEFQKGAENVVVDAQSRMPQSARAGHMEPEESDDVVCVVSSCITHEEFVAETSQDRLLQDVIRWTTSSWPPSKDLPSGAHPFHRLRDELSVAGGLLRCEQFVVPAALTGCLLEAAHESHPGISRTKQRLHEKYWWPGMDRQVEHLIQSCTVCQSVDKSARPVVPPLQSVEFPSGPWKKIGIDIVGPFAYAPTDTQFAMTLNDCFSKWPEVCFTAKVTSSNVSFLRSVFSREGYPEELVSDHGPQFTSVELEQFLEKEG